MHKVLSLSFAVAIVLGLVIASVPSVSAQEGSAIEFDTWVEGELTNDEFAHTYVFEAAAGDIVQIEMYPKPGTFGLSVEVALLDPAGGDLARDNSFIGFSGAYIVRRLAFDGEYTIQATRYDGADGDSEGEYILRIKSVEPLVPGSEVEAPIAQNSELEIPDVFVLFPEEDVTWTIALGYDSQELYPEVTLSSWTGDAFDNETLFELDGEGFLAAAVVTELEAETFYVLYVRRSFYSSFFGEEEAVVSISVSETE